MMVENKVASRNAPGRNDTERRLRGGDGESSLRHEIVGGRVVSMLTGRSVYVMSPPDEPKPPKAENYDESLANIEEVLGNAALAGLQAREHLADTAFTEILEFNRMDVSALQPEVEPELAAVRR